MNKIIGIKSSLDKVQLANKMACNPPLLEVYGREEDLDNITQTKRILRDIRAKGVRVFFHSPELSDGEFLNLGTLNLNTHKKILELCIDCDLEGYIVHGEPADSLRMVQLNLKKLRSSLPKFDTYAYVENVVGPLTKDSFLSFIEVCDIKNICLDISHFAGFHSQEELFEIMSTLSQKSVYYHLSDHVCNDHNPEPLNLGKGSIELKMLFSFVQKGVIETLSANEDEGVEMKEDFTIGQKLI